MRFVGIFKILLWKVINDMSNLVIFLHVNSLIVYDRHTVHVSFFKLNSKKELV